nr:hypothetical protein [Pseudochelatococcus contaminans]
MKTGKGNRLDAGAAHLPAFFANAVDIAQQIAARFQKRFPRTGQTDGIGAAINQFRSHPFFKGADPAAESRLCDVASGRSAGEISRCSKFHEIFQPVEFHHTPDQRTLCKFCITYPKTALATNKSACQPVIQGRKIVHAGSGWLPI